VQKIKKVAPRARFELATLRLTAESGANLSALSGVAYGKSGAIFPSLAAPNVAPKIRAMCTEFCTHCGGGQQESVGDIGCLLVTFFSHLPSKKLQREFILRQEDFRCPCELESG
jgi:hypothetical protein